MNPKTAYEALKREAQEYADREVDLERIFGNVGISSAKEFIEDVGERMPIYFYEKDRLVKEFLEKRKVDGYTKTLIASESSLKECDDWKRMMDYIERSV